MREMEMEKEPILECSVYVDGFEHHTWQGRLRTEAGEMVFHSERELLQVMQELVERELEGGEPS